MLTFEKGNKVQKNSGAELRVTIRNMRPQDDEVVLEWYFIGRERQMPWEEKRKQETVCQRGSETLALSGGKNVTKSVQCNTSHTGSEGGWTSTAYDRVDITGWLVVLRDKDGAVLKSSASKPNLEALLKDKAKFDEFLTRKP